LNRIPDPCRPRTTLALLAGLAWLALPAAADPSLSRAIDLRVGEARQVAAALGVEVVEVESGREVYSFNPDQPRILASNTKLFTTAAAVDLLGPGFEFETPLLMRGAVYDGILDGDLAVVGSGDPNISGRFHDGDVYAVFRAWAAQLKERGVREVSGALYLVDGLFAPPDIHPEWPEDQLARWYEAPVGALSFNDNCLLVRVAPGPRPGAPAKVELDPDLGLYRVVDHLTTTSRSANHRVVVSRQPGSREIVVSGAIHLWSSPVEAWVTVVDPTEYFGAALRAAFAGEGVVIHGASRPVADLPGAVWERVAVERSDLATTIGVINRRSQNFYAESLLKALAARAGGEGSWPEGVRVVEEFLGRAGLGDGLRLADGSGMSRNNRASPRQVTQLLRYMFFHPSGAPFMRSLPASGGEEPAWHRRLAERPYRGNVFAKTGTLNGVSNLSGYAKGGSGRLYAFSILCNGAGAVWRARVAQDRILRELIDHG
jgi:serine-type D-Ala-D-Ala carboxypeptidase/endopeptidase (penicillin-binding protein 4)